MVLNPDALQDLYNVLLSLEWESYQDASGTTTLYLCPICGRDQSEGHSPDCRLQATLRKARA